MIPQDYIFDSQGNLAESRLDVMDIWVYKDLGDDTLLFVRDKTQMVLLDPDTRRIHFYFFKNTKWHDWLRNNKYDSVFMSKYNTEFAVGRKTNGKYYALNLKGYECVEFFQEEVILRKHYTSYKDPRRVVEDDFYCVGSFPYGIYMCGSITPKCRIKLKKF